jgi:hypothetical protein
LAFGRAVISDTRQGGGDCAAATEENDLSIADICLLLGVMIAFGALIIKVIEVTRTK